MTDNDKSCPLPKEVQDFLFKQASIGQICEEFPNIPLNSSLITADAKRGLLYIGHGKKLIVLKPGIDANPEWKLELDLPDNVCRVALNCDCSFLAVTFSQPSALIYDANTINKHKLDILHEIRLSATGGNTIVSDLKWNPAVPEMLCSITSDHTIGCFQVSRDKKTGIQIIGMERPQGHEALCVSWSPKGKQLVIGCKNGDIVQLKPELKMARHLSGPNPTEGMIISILWISNYQFCACYFHPIEQRVSVMIVDAPKGVTTPKFTNYEDITFGSGSMDVLSYYFEHIPEWGIIIAASTHSSEVAVLGTYDNGSSWNLWQLSDGNSGQLPLNRKKKTENYPLGMAVDKSPIHTLPWGESTLPSPVPILRILVTSGQLCCYHLIYLKENVAALCTPPTEIIPVPQLSRPSIAPTEVSFNLPSGATSTPRSKQYETHADRPKLTTNVFGDSSTSSFSFLAPGNRGPPETTPPTEVKNAGFTSSTQVKPTGLFGQGDGKYASFQQENKANKPTFALPTDQQIKPPTSVIQQSVPHSEPKPSGFGLKPDNRTELKTAQASDIQTELKQINEPPKEVVLQHTEEPKQSTAKTPVYDEAICLRAYYEEQVRFEKELKNKLEPSNWICGTEEEQQLLIKRTEQIDEFLRELKETTSSLASDIAYLKALLLQSFAWIEETKSKNSDISIGSRHRSDGKLVDLQRLYNYTQTQLIQATKVLDLEWTEYKNQEMERMKVPSIEKIYQSLIRYNQIIGQEKKNVEDLTKKWRSISRNNSNLNSLDRSMASLNLSQSSITQINETAIDLRCKYIATNARNFSREKQIKLRDLLSENAPKIIRALRPTAVQDRLEATLSSLASLKTAEVTAKPKPTKTTVEQQKLTTDTAKTKVQNPLASLDNFVSNTQNSGASLPPLSKSTSSLTPFSTIGTKLTTISSSTSPKSKENAPMLFAQTTMNQQSLSLAPVDAANVSKPFGISFGSTATQKSSEFQKENLNKTPVESTASKFTFPSFGKLGSPESVPPLNAPSSTSLPTITVPKPSFSFSVPSTSPQNFVPKLDSSSFKFSSKTNTQQTTSAQPAGLDLSNLGFESRPGLTVTPASELKKTSTTLSVPSLSGSLTFGKPTSTQAQQIQQQPNSLFAQSTTQASVSAGITTTSSFPAFGKSLATTSSSVKTGATSVTTQATSASSESSATATVVTTTSTSVFGTSSMFGALSTAPATSFGTTPASTQAVTTTTSAAATTTSTLSFGALAPAAVSSTTNFSGILGATASLSFGTPSTGSSITPAFGKTTAPATGNIFGGTTQTTTSANTNIFGSSTQTTPSSSNIFGSTTQTAATTSSSIFGGTTQAASSASSNIFGKSGAIPSVAAPFGSSAATSSSTTSVFGNTVTTTTGPSMFGNQTATVSSTSAQNSFFTTPVSATAASTGSIFGGATTSAPDSSVFGNTMTTTTSVTSGSIFSSSSTTATSTTSSSVFSNTATAANSKSDSVFASNAMAPSVFGTTPATQQSSIFGTTSNNQSGGSSIFGGINTTQSSSSIFGGGFGATTAAAPTTTANTSVFGGGGASATGSVFGGTAAPVFGTSATPNASIFGSSATTTAATTPASSSIFGTAAASPQTNTGSIFGSTVASPIASPQTGSVFGASPTSPTGASVFGAPAQLGTGSSMFGGATSPAGGSMFGQPSAFGAKPVFGSPTTDFGANKTAFGSTGFGSPPSFGAAPVAGFGNPPILGAGSPLGTTSPGKVLGCSTFEALGQSQSGELSFGSLAQKTPEQNKAQMFQGSSSFSSWR